MNVDSMKGYVILSLQALGYSCKDIKNVLDEITYFIETKGSHEVQMYYINSGFR